MIIQNFDLNLIPDSAPVVVHCDQYDRGTGRLVISLYEGSIAYSPSGTAVIQGVKPDGKGFDYNCTLSGNTVTADLTEQMTAVAGQVRTQIVVTESTGRTGTFVFILDVQRSALPADTDMSESDYQLIEQAIEDAQEAVEDSSAWAIGERGGIPVSPTDETYNNNAKYWAQQAAQYAQGGLHYKGSCLFADIPTTGMLDGDMWNIEDDFTTDSRFREGVGKSVAAGSNIAWISSISKWDVLAMVRIGSLNDLADVSITSPTDGQGMVYDADSGEWVNGDVAVSDMTLATKGIGKPDGITSTVDNNGTFSAKGVGIVADVNSGGTAYGNDWLYYTGTTTVITPESDKMYRVTISGTAYLYYWNGTAYTMLASQGGGGGGASLVDVTTAQYNALTPQEKADATKWYWINDMDGLSGSAIVIGTFAGLTDTNFTNLQNGQVPVYNAATQKWENQNQSGGGVTSFKNRTGAVTPASGDYSLSQISGVDISNINVQSIYDLLQFLIYDVVHRKFVVAAYLVIENFSSVVASGFETNVSVELTGYTFCEHLPLSVEVSTLNGDNTETGVYVVANYSNTAKKIHWKIFNLNGTLTYYSVIIRGAYIKN